MSDNEIIKALECCVRNEICCVCDECPLETRPQCEEVLYREVVDLINRQKAEIERLTAERDMLKGWERLIKAESHAPIIKKAKSEAYKEFAERLNEIRISPSLKATTDRLIKELSGVTREEAEAALRKEDEGNERAIRL